MARRRKGRPVDGILILDKPLGLTSNGALQHAKRAYFAAKAGHTGSLDPLATGVLPICFGEATKFSRFLLDADKIYRSTFQLGVTTASGDADGEILARKDPSLVTVGDVERVLAQFRGPIEQTPSMFSALKHQGTPLYKFARQGLEVERKSRPVVIHALELEHFSPGELATMTVRIHCSKGTYVRTLAEDVGAQLGCGAHVSALRRIQSGPFCLEQSATLDAIQALAETAEYEALSQLLLPVDAALSHLPQMCVSQDMAHYLRQGQAVMAPHLPASGLLKLMLESGELIGIGEPTDDGRVAPRRLIVSQQNPL